MPLTDNTKKAIFALVAGPTVYYMIQRARNQSSPLAPLPPSPANTPIESLHSETDTTPVPIPNTGQPGDMMK